MNTYSKWIGIRKHGHCNKYSHYTAKNLVFNIAFAALGC